MHAFTKVSYCSVLNPIIDLSSPAMSYALQLVVLHIGGTQTQSYSLQSFSPCKRKLLEGQCVENKIFVEFKIFALVVSERICTFRKFYNLSEWHISQFDLSCDGIQNMLSFYLFL